MIRVAAALLASLRIETEYHYPQNRKVVARIVELHLSPLLVSLDDTSRQEDRGLLACYSPEPMRCNMELFLSPTD